MMTRQELEGHWNQVKGSLRERWAELRGDDLDAAYGDMEQLVGVVQEKTGEPRAEIENAIEDAIANGAASMENVKEKVKEYADDVRQKAQAYSQDAAEYAKQNYAEASQRVRDGYEQASQSMHEGYQQAQGVVKKRPLESVAVTFGVGLLAGVLIGLSSGRRG